MATSITPPLPLADIHLPDAPSYWPLAWGWWLAFAAIVLLFIAFFMLMKRRNQSLAAKKAALKQLNTITDEQGLSAINTLLKQAALSYYPRARVAPLTGEAWLMFLDQQLPEKKRGFTALQAQWLTGTYSNTTLTETELAQCKTVAKRWLTHALPPQQKMRKESLNV